MNLFGSPAIVYLDRQKIIVAVVKRGVVNTEIILDQAWNETDLIKAAKIIKERFGKKVLLLIGEDLSYIFYEKLLDEKESTTDQVKNLIRKQIPEDIHKLHWGYRLIDTDEEEAVAQVIAFVTQFVSHLQPALEESGLQILHAEPLSTSLATQLTDSAEPRILLYQGMQNLALVVHKQAVVASETLESFSDSNLKSFLKFITEKKKVHPQGILVVGDPELSNDVSVKKVDLNPFLGILRNYQEKNQVKIDLSLERKDQDESKVDANEKKSSSDHRRVMVLLGILLLLAGITGGLLYAKGYLKLGNGKTEDQPQASLAPAPETITPTASSAASLIPISLAEYSVSILNGSGKAGEAGVVEKLLLAEGFSEIETSNAENFDYTQTVVQLREDIPSEVYDELERALNSEYVMELQKERLIADSKYDVILILGSLEPKTEEEE